MTGPGPQLVVDAGDPRSPEARALIAELDRYQEALYPAESNHLVPVEALCAPGTVFVLARLDGQAAGCGALLERGEFGQTYGELKRMYVRPSMRRCGVGRRLLSALTEAARARGLAALRLETGIHQPEALALYESAGFRRCAPFAGYREDPLSLFMQLPLT